MAGYHVNEIKRGVVGDISKIEEEMSEFHDALKQGNDLMALLELSDLIGAIELYVLKKHKGTVTLDHLLKMKEATKRAFETGARK